MATGTRPLRRRRGFILLETLVAFAILAIMLAAAYRITGTGGATLARAEAAAQVLDLMQSELDELLAGRALVAGTETGPLSSGFNRIRTIRRVRANRQTGDQAILYRIELTAFAASDTDFRKPVLRLETLRVERGTSP